MLELCCTEARATQIRRFQDGVSEITAGQIGPRQVRPAQVGCAQIPAREIPMNEPQEPQIRPRETVAVSDPIQERLLARPRWPSPAGEGRRRRSSLSITWRLP